jgi:hypothetical protein
MREMLVALTPRFRSSRVLKIRSAIPFVALSLAAGCHGSPNAEEASVVVPDYIQAQARWVKAQRDRSNAQRAENFQRPNRLEAEPDSVTTVNSEDTASGDTD